MLFEMTHRSLCLKNVKHADSLYSQNTCSRKREDDSTIEVCTYWIRRFQVEVKVWLKNFKLAEMKLKGLETKETTDR